jgi:hypothetical protein
MGFFSNGNALGGWTVTGWYQRGHKQDQAVANSGEGSQLVANSDLQTLIMEIGAILRETL